MAPTDEKLPLSLTEKLGFWWAIASVVLKAPIVALHHAIFPPADSLGVRRAVLALFLKTITSIPERQRSAMMNPPSTGDEVVKYCTKNNILHKLDLLPRDTKLHWVGPQPSYGEKVLIYFHGGGYAMSAGPTHTSFAAKCAADALASLAVLEYSLSDKGPFPIQLREAIVALKHVISLTPPSKIIIAGDSAGGHLAATLLSHLAHPSKDLEEIKLSEKLGGICFISPFLSFDYDKVSYRENADFDYLTMKAMRIYNSAALPEGVSAEDAIKDPILSPGDAPKGWWENAPVETILITVGGKELFRDDAVKFGEILKSEAGAQTKIDVVVGANEWHAAPIVDPLAGVGLDDISTGKAILTWMSAFGE